MSSPVWLITGASSGFGLILVLRALRANHRVIGTVRNKTKSATAVNQIEFHGGCVIQMDATASQEIIVAKTKEAEAIYGRIDILVNNAGYAELGALQYFTESEVKLQFQTHVFGPLFIIQAVLPGMRQREQGQIVNISSVCGMDAPPISGMYGSSKFALEGISESLSKEVAEFGITVLIVEPGAFRTNLLKASRQKALSPDYKDTLVETVTNVIEGLSGDQLGDAVKAVERMFEVITGEGKAGRLRGKVLRLPLGMDAIERIEVKASKVVEDVLQARKLEEEDSTRI